MEGSGLWELLICGAVATWKAVVAMIAQAIEAVTKAEEGETRRRDSNSKVEKRTLE